MDVSRRTDVKSVHLSCNGFILLLANGTCSPSRELGDAVCARRVGVAEGASAGVLAMATSRGLPGRSEPSKGFVHVSRKHDTVSVLWGFGF